MKSVRNSTSHLSRSHLLNALIKELDSRVYLEIGIKKCTNFSTICAPKKIGVDPRIGLKLHGLARAKRLFYKAMGTPLYYRDSSQVLYAMTSDQYFSSRFSECVDIVFIDGLHHFDQVLTDFINACNTLTPNGVIVFHDCLPANPINASRIQKTKTWNGDVWKAIYWLVHQSIDITVFEFDEGCGLVKNPPQQLSFPSPSELARLDTLTFDDFTKLRNTELTLICEKDANELIQHSNLMGQ